jgi:hypothetical protein
LRNKFSYVAKIAGYQAVPAEEMVLHDPETYQSPQPAPKVAVRASQTAKKTLAEAILAYTDQNKVKAGNLLKEATDGKFNSVRDMTEQQAAAALTAFNELVISKLDPADDDFPEFELSREPGSDDA